MHSETAVASMTLSRSVEHLGVGQMVVAHGASGP